MISLVTLRDIIVANDQNSGINHADNWKKVLFVISRPLVSIYDQNTIYIYQIKRMSPQNLPDPDIGSEGLKKHYSNSPLTQQFLNDRWKRMVLDAIKDRVLQSMPKEYIKEFLQHVSYDGGGITLTVTPELMSDISSKLSIRAVQNYVQIIQPGNQLETDLQNLATAFQNLGLVFDRKRYVEILLSDAKLDVISTMISGNELPAGHSTDLLALNYLL